MTRENETETVQDASEKEDVSPRGADQSAAGSSPEAAKQGEGSFEEVRKERAELYDRYMRAVADLDNYRRRAAREKDELRQFAISSVVEDLLPVLDNLGLALQAGKQSTEAGSVTQGVGMVLEQLKSTLSKHGLTEINPAGEEFDPNKHEALSHQPDPEMPDGKISQVIRTGYILNGRLIRPAAVVVSSGAPE